VDKKKFKHLLQNYHQEKASKQEQYIVDSWYELLDASARTVPELEDKRIREALRKRLLHGALGIDSKTKWYRSPWWQAAAMLLLVSSLLLWLRPREKIAPQALKESLFVAGERQLKKIILPDSSIVWLNARSKLRVKPGYSMQNRDLVLEGEAFFEVKTDPVHPLRLNVPGIQVQVLGTTFNVKAYQGLPEITVALQTGKVQVHSTETQQMQELIPGDKIIYNKQQKHFTFSHTNIDHAQNWRSGYNVLEQASFEELSEVFQNLYGLQLQTRNPRVKKSKYDLTLRSTQTAEQALKTICNILNTTYKKEENERIEIY